MNDSRLRRRARKRCSVLFLLAVALLFQPRPAQALGPNIMTNSGFEGGDYAYANAAAAPFSIVKGPAHAHTGAWALRANIQPSGSCSLRNPLLVWPNTRYTTSVWYKGRGTLQLQVLNGEISAALAQVNFTATPSWRKATVSYTTGNIPSLQVKINEVGGAGTAVYLDDFYTGLTDAHTLAFDPNHPTSSGFKLLFDDEFTDSRTIDVHNTQGAGYHWYLN